MMGTSARDCEVFLRKLSPLASEDRAKWEQRVAEEAPDFNALSFFKSREELVSGIIAFLLTPTASHGQGQLFLRAFLSVLGVPFQAVRCVVVEPESPCYKLQSKRRMDILIRFADESGETVIVIESKSHLAGDQPSQIKEYLAHIKKAYPRARKLLFYLKDGGPPSEESIPLKEWRAAHVSGICAARDFTSVMCEWLQECRTERMPQRILTFLQDFGEFSGLDKEDAVANANGVRDAVVRIIQSAGSADIAPSDLDALLALYELNSEIWESAARVFLASVQALLKEQLPHWESRCEVSRCPYFELSLWKKAGWTTSPDGTSSLRVVIASEDQDSKVPTYIDMYVRKHNSFMPRGVDFNSQNNMIIGEARKNDFTRQLELGGLEDLRSAAAVRYMLTRQGATELSSKIFSFISDYEVKMDTCFGRQ